MAIPASSICAAQQYLGLQVRGQKVTEPSLYCFFVLEYHLETRAQLY